jgi:phosphatidylinositol alpha-1,6-mannosyltransferase
MTLGRVTVACADEVVAVSRATQDYLSKIARIGGTVIYNGVDVACFHPRKERAKIRRDLAIPVCRTVCLCIRRITFKNGIETLLEAAEVLQNRRDIIFLIGGDGRDLPSARKIVQEKKLDNVRLLGSVSDGDLPRYYAASDMFVLPSKTGEGFPLVVLEALASGLPVIATRSGGHVEIISDGETGYVVEPNDALGIAKYVVSLSENQVVLERMQERSREFAVKTLSWEHNVEQLLMVMRMATKRI